MGVRMVLVHKGLGLLVVVVVGSVLWIGVVEEGGICGLMENL